MKTAFSSTEAEFNPSQKILNSSKIYHRINRRLTDKPGPYLFKTNSKQINVYCLFKVR